MGDAFAFVGQRLARILVGRQLLRDSNHAAMLQVSKVQMRELFLKWRGGEKKNDFEFVQKLSSNVLFNSRSTYRRWRGKGLRQLLLMMSVLRNMVWERARISGGEVLA